MLSSSTKFFLPLFCLLPLISGNVLQVNQEGIFSFSPKEDEGPTLPVCFIKEKDSNECKPGEQFSLSVRALKKEQSRYRKTQKQNDFKLEDLILFSMFFPPMSYNPGVPQGYPVYQQPGYVTSYQYPRNGVWSIHPLSLFMEDGLIVTNDRNSIFFKYRQSDSDKASIPEVIPMSSTGCLPVNNSICEEEQIKAFDEHLEKLKASLGRKGSARSSVEEEQKEDNEEEDEVDESLAEHFEKARKIVGFVVKNIKEQAGATGRSVVIRKLNVELKDLDVDSAHVEIEKEKESDEPKKPEPSARSRPSNQRIRGKF